MRIKEVSISKLVTGRNYSNYRCGAVAEVAEDEDPEKVMEDTERFVDRQLAKQGEIDIHLRTISSCQIEISALNRTITGLKKQVNKGLEILRTHEKIAALAKREGLEVPAALGGDDIPF